MGCNYMISLLENDVAKGEINYFDLLGTYIYLIRGIKSYALVKRKRKKKYSFYF